VATRSLHLVCTALLPCAPRRARNPGSPTKDVVQVFYQFRNDGKAGLGIPMPAGIVRVYQQDSRDGVQFVGEDRIDHTPKDETLSLKIGNAFDIVAERKQVTFEKIASNVYYVGSELLATFLIVTPQGPQAIAMDLRSIKRLGLTVIAVVAVLIAFYAGARWETWLYFLNGTAFGQRDPVLGHDIGFYVFTLPLLEQIHGLLYLVVLLMAATAVGAYLFGEELGLDATRGIYLSRRATRHLGILAGILLLVLAYGAWLQIPQLLNGVSGNMAGATYTDVHARIPALRILIGAALLSAALVVWQAFSSGRLSPTAISCFASAACSP